METAGNRFQLEEDRVTWLVPRLFPLSTHFGMTNDPCHPELVSGSSLALHYKSLQFPRPLRERVRVRGKFGFTLPEVLITLGIIGIITAMTLPSLTNKYQHKVLESQFKKSYANLQTAINTVNSENGIPYECYTLKYGGNYYYTQCNEFWPKVLEQYKTAKECGNWRKPQCRSKYKSKAEVIAAGGSINNTACSFSIDSHTAYNLNDGSIIYLYKVESDYNNHGSLFFGIDVNGKKGPNKWGYDLFYLNLYKRNQKAPVLGLTAVCELLEKGGISAEEMMLK